MTPGGMAGGWVEADKVALAERVRNAGRVRTEPLVAVAAGLAEPGAGCGHSIGIVARSRVAKIARRGRERASEYLEASALGQLEPVGRMAGELDRRLLEGLGGIGHFREHAFPARVLVHLAGHVAAHGLVEGAH